MSSELNLVPLESLPHFGTTSSTIFNKNEFTISFNTNHGSKRVKERVHKKSNQKYFVFNNSVIAIWDESEQSGVIYK